MLLVLLLVLALMLALTLLLLLVLSSLAATAAKNDVLVVLSHDGLNGDVLKVRIRAPAVSLSKFRVHKDPCSCCF